jgi:hypothetical protein
MKRQEEIIEASINYTMKNRPNVLAGDRFSEEMKIFNRNKHFEEGAKWADKTMIDKACEWINMNIIDYIVEGSREGISLEDKKQLIEDFRNTMEE